jgi:hypothetical protein
LHQQKEKMNLSYTHIDIVESEEKEQLKKLLKEKDEITKKEEMIISCIMLEQILNDMIKYPPKTNIEERNRSINIEESNRGIIIYLKIPNGDYWSMNYETKGDISSGVSWNLESLRRGDVYNNVEWNNFKLTDVSTSKHYDTGINLVLMFKSNVFQHFIYIIRRLYLISKVLNSFKMKQEQHKKYVMLCLIQQMTLKNVPMMRKIKGNLDDTLSRLLKHFRENYCDIELLSECFKIYYFASDLISYFNNFTIEELFPQNENEKIQLKVEKNYTKIVMKKK